MQKLSLIQRPLLVVATMALVSLPAGLVLAQGTPNTAAPATAAPAATAPAATPPAATPPAAATTTAPAAKTETTTAAEPAKPAKKKTAKKMTRQQEIDKSIDTGTVPARYRSSVPKEYHHLIPFDKR
ncbi:MAG: hypothetical protein JWR80_5587 [Bradyrhizobium sp.]|nr:hypothetical protein [Bradyrhizobium sp.]